MVDRDVEPARGRVESCLYCGDTGLVPSFAEVEDFFFRNVAGQFDYRACRRCGSLVLVDPLGAEVLHEAYSRYYTHNSSAIKGRRGVREFLRKQYLARRFGAASGPVPRVLSALYRRLATDFDTIDRAGRYAPSAPVTMLDYGCGDGEFLERMREFGNHVEGVDFDPVCVRQGIGRGLALCMPEDVPSYKWQARFDFISLNHVIEHVPDPKGLLVQLSEWLKPGGTLFLETPNANASGLEIFGRYWRGLEAPRHLSVPSAMGLLQAAELAGFKAQRQIVSASLREHLWQECLTVVPHAEQAPIARKMAAAPPLSNENAEFLTLLFAKTC